MGLNNIQRSKQKVLNRPMFAKMKDGRIKPVQYAMTGKLIMGGGSVALPYIGRGLTAIRNTLPAIITKGRNLVTGGGKTTTAGPGTSIIPFTSGVPSVISTASKKVPMWKQLTKLVGFGSTPLLLSELSNLSEKEKEEDKYKGSGKVERPKDSPTGIPSKKEEVVETEVITDINKGNLDEMISERIDLFKEKLGSGEGRMKSAGFGLLTELGLNLMSARGGNLLDKISRSAKDPLKTFTKIGQAINDRMDKITMAGIESGAKAFESKEDRQLAREQIEAEAKPDDVKTLEYFMATPGLKDLPVEDLIRLSKSKAVMSDDEFYKELALNLSANNITDAKTINEIFTNIQAASPTGGGMTIEKQISTLKAQGKTDTEIKAAILNAGLNPADYVI